MKAYQKRTPEEIADQKRALLDRADKGLTDLAEKLASSETTDAIKEWSLFVSRFHNYSLHNQCLIASQRPTASHCAGFGKWKELNRSVKKGEKGIAILAPVIRKNETTNDAGLTTTESKIRGFRTVYVFDVAQTEGEALPVHPAKNLTDASPEDLARVETAIRSLCPIVDDETPPRPGVMGWTDGKKIHVTRDQSTGSRLSVLIHEAAHFILHFEDGKLASSSDLPRDMAELEAEATACAVSSAMGYEFAGFAACYMAQYGATTDKVKESIPRIRKAIATLCSLLTDKAESEDEE